MLKKIIEHKLREVELLKRNSAMEKFISSKYFSRTPLSIAHRMKSDFGIIAEFKRKSPSTGRISEVNSIETVVCEYEKRGAAAISCLTDTPFFGAEPGDLNRTRGLVDIPILKKDFIIDALQIFQAKAEGADFILLIAAVLTKPRLLELCAIAHDLGLEVLLELHHEQELDKMIDTADLIGVNNRNLNDLTVDTEQAIKLFPLLPRNRPLIAESGYQNTDQLKEIEKTGYNGALIGTSLLTSPMAFNQLLTQSI